jgi:hypothetical protein
MEQRKTGTITMHYEPGHDEIAGLLTAVIDETSWILRARWSLAFPEDCHLVVMTSWQQFFMNAAPPIYKLGLALTLPLWVRRVRAMWPVAGGWTNRFGRRVAIGVKPPSLLAQADRRIGERLFVRVDDPNEKVRQITCHELTHAATTTRKLPMWLNEGLATRAVDHLAGYPTIRADTLDLFSRRIKGAKPPGYRQLRVEDRDAVAYEYARGYWLVRMLDEQFPDVLARCLESSSDRERLEMMSLTLGLPQGGFWPGVNHLLLDAYLPRQEPPSS